MRYTLLFLMAFAIGLVSAQTQTLGNYEEVVYLKNGSIIHGIIIEMIPGKSLKIQTSERNVFVYQMDEVEKITKEIPAGGGAHSDGRKQKGFELYLDEGLALWIASDPYPTNMFTVTPGYKFSHAAFLGVGTGIIARKGFVSVPVTIDARFTLTKTKVAPLLQLNAGYMSPNLLTLSNDDYYYTDVNKYGGFLLGFKPGLGINLKKNIDLNFYAGYQLGSQIVKTSSSYYYYSDNSTNLGLMHFFVFTAGVKF